ncbi:MAG: transcriptional regulator [Solirubrobacterales bacterium]|nr:transcriptional regulator [Solirubrobacterales bacterium]
MLCELGRADFAYPREALPMTDGNLSRNLSRLHDAGYVEITKTVKPRPRTWISVTPAGRAALELEFVALRQLISRVERAAPSGGSLNLWGRRRFRRTTCGTGRGRASGPAPRQIVALD